MRAITVDIDGVLADASARFATLMVDGEPDWDRFHDARMDRDPQLPWCEVLKLIGENNEVDIILITNRLEVFRERTERWLQAARVPYDRLLMRREEVGYEANKAFQLDCLRLEDYTILFGVDDDPFHIDVYKSRNIPLVEVHSGYNNGEILPDRRQA